MKKIVFGLAIAILAIVGFVFSGFYDVRASSEHSTLVSWLLSTTSRSSIERGARGLEIPDLSDPDLLRAGINDYEAMCVDCHGGPGRSPSPMGRGLNPLAPDLALSDLSPAELFWVTKHGIKMTGMPAWGATHQDAQLWPVVAFLRTLPDLGPSDYEARLAAAAGVGHHASEPTPGDHANDSGAHGSADNAAEEPPCPDDGHDH